jgi:hypothetical protein
VNRRAFALPLVLTFVIIGTLILAMVLERFSGQRATIQRQLDTYQDHHVARGLREAVDAWLGAAATETPANSSPIASGSTPPTPKTIEDYLGQDNHAFDLTLAGSSTRPVSIYLFEAQGKLLADFTGLSPTELQLAAGAVAMLPDVVTGRDPKAFLRKEGPLQVSVRSAPQEVLEAIGRSVLGQNKGSDLAQEILRARQLGVIDTTKLNEVYQKVGVAPEDMTRLQSLLSASPWLWLVVAEMEGSDGDLVRYQGLTTVRGAARASNRQSNNRPGQFLTWERVFDVTQPRGAEYRTR